MHSPHVASVQGGALERHRVDRAPLRLAGTPSRRAAPVGAQVVVAAVSTLCRRLAFGLDVERRRVRVQGAHCAARVRVGRQRRRVHRLACSQGVLAAPGRLHASPGERQSASTRRRRHVRLLGAVQAAACHCGQRGQAVRGARCARVGARAVGGEQHVAASAGRASTATAAAAGRAGARPVRHYRSGRRVARSALCARSSDQLQLQLELVASSAASIDQTSPSTRTTANCRADTFATLSTIRKCLKAFFLFHLFFFLNFLCCLLFSDSFHIYLSCLTFEIKKNIVANITILVE